MLIHFLPFEGHFLNTRGPIDEPIRCCPISLGLYYKNF
jgi:hypothetical protein